MYQGVLAVGKVPAPLSLETVLNMSAKPNLFAAVDGLTSAENLGVLVRNCAAFGVQALIVEKLPAALISGAQSAVRWEPFSNYPWSRPPISPERCVS